MPPLPADFSHTRVCKPFCEKSLTLPAEVLSQKKKLYPEYRRARDEMRELLTVKANVDRVLNMEAPEAGREKDHSQR